MGKSGKNKEIPTKKIESEFSPTVNEKSNQNVCPIEEKDIRKLISSVERLTEKYDAIQVEIASIKLSQNKIFESHATLEGRVESLEKDLQVLRETDESKMIREELEDIKKKNEALYVAQGNDRVVLRNLPLGIHEDQREMKCVIHKVLGALELDIPDSNFEAFSMKAAETQSTNLVVRFSSSMLKTQVVKKFREAKKSKPFESLRIENFVTLPQNHHLIGKTLMITNKLDHRSTQLILKARKYVSSHFDFVFDSPDGTIFAKIGRNFHKIESEDDIEQLVKKISYEKNMALLKIEIAKYRQSNFKI